MSEKTPPDPLARLGEKIEQARREQLRREGKDRGAMQSPMGLAWRVAVELVATFAVGVGLGLGFDHLFGTRPWGLIVGLFLGGAAGMLNVFRAAKDLGRGPPAGGNEERD